MTKVSFYIVPGQSADALLRTACRVCDKAYSKGHKVFVHLNTPAEAARLDDILWTFRDGSFIPHCRSEDLDPALPPPVVVGTGEPPADHADVLVNLAAEVPEFFSRFERVTEIVDNDVQRRERGRHRFRYYRDRGYPLETHKL